MTSTSGQKDSRPTFRVVMLGDQGVGKSSISHRFIKDDFIENNAPTVGAAYLTQFVKVGDQSIKLDLWDTAGQERFATLAPMYYRTANAAVVVYDICSTKSYERALKWISELEEKGATNTLVVLCGNKADRAAEARQVNPEEASRSAKDKGIHFTEVSAKTGMAVKEVFEVIANTLVSRAGSNNQQGQQDTVKLSKKKESKSKCACGS